MKFAPFPCERERLKTYRPSGGFSLRTEAVVELVRSQNELQTTASETNAILLTWVKVPRSTRRKIGMDNTLIIKNNTIESCAKNAVDVTIPNGITKVADEAFKDCRLLESISIPNTVTEIGNSAFSGCTSLKSFRVPDEIKKISGWLLKDCSACKKLTIPSSVKEIRWEAFSGCTSLYQIIFLGSIDLWENIESDDGWHTGVPAEFVDCMDGKTELFFQSCINPQRRQANLHLISITPILVTPEKAAVWIGNNPHNRPAKQSRVAELAEFMKQGKWIENTDFPIEVLDTGELLNGQHRLTAIMQSGVSLLMTVAIYKK